MGTFSNKKSTLLLVILLTSAALLINPTQASAKADFYDSDEDWVSWYTEEDWTTSEGDEDTHSDSGIGGNVEPKSVGTQDSQFYHSNHQHIIHTAGVFNSSPEVPNQAVFNENCSPTVKCHNPDNLVCSATDGTGKCVCKEGYVYLRHTESCSVIPKLDQEICKYDIQCHERNWGKISRCSKVSMRCECYDYLSNGRQDTGLVEGVCYIKKSVGAPCNTSDECHGHIRGETYCKPGDRYSAGGIHCTIINGEIQCSGGTCQCKDTHLWFKPLSQCLLWTTKPGSACKVNEHCMMFLGRYSRCDTSSGTCKCGPPRSNEADIPESVFYEPLRKCFLKKAYNDTCEENYECIASLGPDVTCGKTEDSPEMNTCHCSGGRVCGSRRVERPHIELGGGNNNIFKVVPSSGSWIISDAVIGIMTLAMNGIGMGWASRC
ncbi:unnamed protein product [Orchesella dallaii]|uniref:Uncharacterized protein n=1 Tax=Orchesella dallaii TaxID=48710 RepID=A0ABP1Q8H3_9HEXA